MSPAMKYKRNSNTHLLLASLFARFEKEFFIAEVIFSSTRRDKNGGKARTKRGVFFIAQECFEVNIELRNFVCSRAFCTAQNHPRVAESQSIELKESRTEKNCLIYASTSIVD